MKGVKELKARLKSIGNIRKITSTMELVAAAKLRRLQDRALATRPYGEAIRAMIARVSAAASGTDRPLLQQAEKVERECVVVIAADRGLCGAFNSNVLRKAVDHIKERQGAGVAVEVYAFGVRAEKFFRRIKADLAGVCDEKVEKVDYRRVATTMESLTNDFLGDRFQRVSVVYTWMKSTASFIPKVETLLPVEPPKSADAVGEGDDANSSDEAEYILQPSPDEILDSLLPKALQMQLYGAVMESLASEFAARRMAMKNATDAADDMTGELRLEYNKARQAGITADLLDIVAGAEAQAG